MTATSLWRKIVTNFRISINKDLYGATQSLVAWIDGEQVGGASLTLYPAPRMLVSAYSDDRFIPFEIDSMPPDLWEQAELMLRLMLSATLIDRSAA